MPVDLLLAAAALAVIVGVVLAVIVAALIRSTRERPEPGQRVEAISAEGKGASALLQEDRRAETAAPAFGAPPPASDLADADRWAEVEAQAAAEALRRIGVPIGAALAGLGAVATAISLARLGARPILASKSVSQRRGSSTGIRTRFVGVALAVAAMLGSAPAAAFAAESDVKLSLRPVGIDGQFFEVTMAPGETQTLEVELGNQGESAIAARTYAADVYTIINGGFGAELRDAPASGTTLWLEYPTEVFQLPPGQGIRRTFTVRVPSDAAPGEYITSLVLENDTPIQGGGDVAINQVLRQALAVVITVPGPRTPRLEVGAAIHTIVADRSVVAVSVRNTGNVRLKPVAQFTLRDAAGAQVSQSTVAMDSFYAGTETLVEVPLAALLQPGAYSVGLTLEDAAAGARIEAPAIPLGVEPPPSPPPAVEGTVPGLTEVIQSIQSGQVPPWAAALMLLGAVLIGLVGGLLILALVRRRRRRDPASGRRPNAK